jgi:2-(1,2-epoxy-1,2-dihydrophenyl)acetyl-CoA isomerase
MPYDTIRCDRRGAQLRILLDRPESMNAWNRALGEELLDAIRAAAADESVRAVVIAGAGRAFSSGADLRAGFDPTPEGHPDVRRTLEERYHPIIAGIREMPKPVLAAVNGPAVGIGCSLALACDLVAMRADAYLLLAFVNIGLAPDGGSSLFVPARAGHARASQMALLGERVDAARAVEWGLANFAWSVEDFESGVDALAARLAEGPTRAYAGIKRLLNARLFDGMARQLDLEAEVQQELAASSDFAEGVQAFVGRRPAAFEGR